jgi:hypothetical protein
MGLGTDVLLGLRQPPLFGRIQLLDPMCGIWAELILIRWKKSLELNMINSMNVILDFFLVIPQDYDELLQCQIHGYCSQFHNNFNDEMSSGLIYSVHKVIVPSEMDCSSENHHLFQGEIQPIPVEFVVIFLPM